ncbi:MAG TPA: hypothetical protein VLZ55_05605, partial [Rhodanobacter sp.]|nr:hypothetical protein [Rhodanobacter sp.]
DPIGPRRVRMWVCTTPAGTTSTAAMPQSATADAGMAGRRVDNDDPDVMHGFTAHTTGLCPANDPDHDHGGGPAEPIRRMRTCAALRTQRRAE